MTRTEVVKGAIARLPRVRLAHLPTPLMEAGRLSRTLGGPRIVIKRDDLTELPLTGNKTRMFEFSLARALELGADTVVFSSSVQSNYCRQLALACAPLGIDVHLVLNPIRGQKDLEIQGNLLLTLLAGAHVEIVECEMSERPRLVEEKAGELRRRGRNVYLPRATDYDLALEAAAYLGCAVELHEQLASMALNADYLFVSACDTTQAGLLVGAKYLGAGFQIIGVNPLKLHTTPTIVRIANTLVELLKLDMPPLVPEDVVNTTEYVGERYGVATPAGLESMRIALQTEGILLDPIYTGKTLAALRDYIARGVVGPDHTVIFLHTGGMPLVFAYNEDVMALIEEKPRVALSGHCAEPHAQPPDPPQTDITDR